LFIFIHAIEGHHLHLATKENPSMVGLTGEITNRQKY
jgi:RNase P/RNase MRP subunit p29